MEHKSIQGAASFLEICILATLLLCRGSSLLMLTGVIYLLAALGLAVSCVFLAIGLRARHGAAIPEQAPWLRRRKSCVLLLLAWELAVVAWLNILAFIPTRFPYSAVLGYPLVGVFVVLSYRMVALADRSDQAGGSMPLNFFGRPRPRWMLFWAFVYTPVGLVVGLSLTGSGNRHCPALLQPPQVWLLLLALLSAVSAALARQRYRRGPPNRGLALWIIAPTVCGLACTTALQFLFGYNLNVYLLSSATVACIAVTVYWLLLAEEARAAEQGQPEGPPE